MVEYTIAHFAKNQELHRIIPSSEIFVDSTFTKFFSTPTNNFNIPKTINTAQFNFDRTNSFIDLINNSQNLSSIPAHLQKSTNCQQKCITDVLVPLSHIVYKNDGTSAFTKERTLKADEQDVHTIIHQYPFTFNEDYNIYGFFLI